MVTFFPKKAPHEQAKLLTKTAQATHAKQLTSRQLRANFELELMD